MADLDDTEAARDLLKKVWPELARNVDEANRLKSEAKKDPTLLRNPWVDAVIRWRDLFDRELAAVQTVYEAAEAGAKLSPDEFRTAREAGEKLLGIISQARERALLPA